jgi:glycogen synthase
MRPAHMPTRTVAIFASAYYPHMGGVEEAVRQLARAYRQSGVETIVLTNRWPRSLPPVEVYEGTSVYRLPMRVPDGSPKAHVTYHLTHRLVKAEVFRILREHGVELLHVQCVSANGYYALLAKRKLRLPLVTTTQGERTIDAGGLYQRSRFMNRVLRQLMAESDHVTACSRHTLRDIEQYLGREFGPRGSVVYNGVEPDDFAGVRPFRHRRPYVLAIGRLVPQKGFDVLLDAFGRAQMPSHDLVLAGEGPERAKLERIAAQLALGDRACFVGRADRGMAAALFRGCSFFVLPSRDEPQGIVNLEAMAAGKAVIATRVGGVPEIVPDGRAGLLVEAGDTEGIARAMETLAANPELRERFGTAGREWAARFTWTDVARRYLDIYDSLCGRPTARVEVGAGA